MSENEKREEDARAGDAARTAAPADAATGAAARPGAAAAPGPTTAAPSQQELAIRSALETVHDPEIMLSVIDLGLIREVRVDPEKTLIRMLLTTPFCPYAPQLMAEVKQAVAGWGPIDSWIELERIGWQRGLAFVREDPKRFVRHTWRKFLHLWSLYPADAVSHNGPLAPTRTFIVLMSYGLLLLLGLLGMLVSLRDWRRFALVYAYIGSLTVAYSLLLPSTWYRLPIDFFLAIFAAIFVDALVHRWRDQATAKDTNEPVHYQELVLKHEPVS